MGYYSIVVWTKPADCTQNLPEKVKPYSGPLVKIIILLSVCTASFLNTLAVNIP